MDHQDITSACNQSNLPSQGRIQDFLIGGVRGVTRKCEVEESFFWRGRGRGWAPEGKYEGDAPLQFGVFRGPSPENFFEISSSEKCILMDPGDGFAMDNGARESKKNPQV